MTNTAPPPAKTADSSEDPWASDTWAARFQKPGWRDPRLIVGIVLLALGIGVGSFVVNAASNTVPVYTAATTLSVGSAIKPEDLTTTQVRVPNHENNYVTLEMADATWWEENPQVARTVAKGEMVPISAVTTHLQDELRPVTFSVPPAGAHDLAAGTRVDLWHVSDVNSDAPPESLAQGLEVSAIEEDSGPLSVAGTAAVTVLVPQENLSKILGAKSSAGSVELVRHLSGFAQ